MNDTAAFWKGDFGDAYNRRNTSTIPKRIAMFAKILARAIGVKTVLELGCGTGQNLVALRALNPDLDLTGVEVNQDAANACAVGTIHCAPILGMPDLLQTWDLVFTRGVLIHTQPADLPQVYERMVNLSNRYVMCCEYFSPARVCVPYRGEADKLWKADYAGELMATHNLRLIDYGFVYSRGPFAQDNVTWFLMEKQ